MDYDSEDSDVGEDERRMYNYATRDEKKTKNKKGDNVENLDQRGRDTILDISVRSDMLKRGGTAFEA